MSKNFKVYYESPYNVALIRGGATDATVRVEFYDLYGRVLPFNGASSATLTISSTAKSLHNFVTGGIPRGAVGGRMLVLTESICVNTGGSNDGNGTNGFDDGAMAPTADSPRRYGAGDAFEFGAFPQ